MDRFLTASEVCDALRISRATFYNLVRAGKIRTVRIGRQHLVPAEAIRRIEAAALGDDDNLAA